MHIEELWHQHGPRLRGFIAKRANDAHSVDDILQVVFLKAHMNLHTVKTEASVVSWLYRIATNAIADHYRAHRPLEELPEDIAAPEHEQDHVGELSECLPPLISALPDKYGRALLLSEIDGLPQKEVAQRLGISLSGAKSRIQRGREKLRDKLLECCDIRTGRTGIIGYEPRNNIGICNSASDASFSEVFRLQGYGTPSCRDINSGDAK